MKITFVTGNSKKIKKAKNAFENYDLNLETVNIELHEIQADTNEEVAEKKAEDAARKLERPVIVADGALYIEALDGFPGPYASYADSTIGAEGILKLMEQRNNRSAEIRYVLCYSDGKKTKKFISRITGKISEKVKEQQGLFDQIFELEEGKTLGQLSEEEWFDAWGNPEKRFAEWYIGNNR